MLINWPMLGIWFGAALGVFFVSAAFVYLTGWGSSGTLIDFVICMMALWIFSTGVVRSVSSWGVPLSWLAGLIAAVPILYALSLPLMLVDFLFHVLPDWWKKWRKNVR